MSLLPRPLYSPARMTEWLETDGLGGFAMGTHDAIRTRRYHALLLAPRDVAHAPAERMVLVADLEVFVETAAGRFALSSHRYGVDGETVYPDGARYLRRFTAAPWPRWEWALPGGTVLARELVVEHSVATSPGLARGTRVAVRWTRLEGAATSLHVQPLLAGRDYHATHHENAGFQFEPELAGDCVTWRPYLDVPAIHAAANGLYQHAPDWYRTFYLSEEAVRGLDATEDLASPGSFTFDLASGPAALVLSTVWIAEDAAQTAAAIFTREAARRADLGSPLLRAADAFVIERGSASEFRTVIAGYPWFTDWGRDTFIALRGLCLATGRLGDARAILLRWAGALSRGMLPNRFDEHADAPEYNSVDAALWFVIAADAYLRAAPSDADRPVLAAAIAAIVDAYQAGTRHGIRADADGLLACGEPGDQLTWMDARVDGNPVTPRLGKPVEINALWINALIIAGRTDDAEKARAAFARFWDPQRRQLHDVLDADHVRGATDPSCRPNQLFALGGVPHPVLDPASDQARAVVDTVERLLWTPAGPRSLSAGDPHYRATYLGPPAERDRAYHNGTVWPWLAGAFIEAWVRVRGDTPSARREARQRFLDPMLARGGYLAELADGDPPHAAAGCPFQAWSVAELLRLDCML